MVADTGIQYNRLEKGIAHYYTDARAFDTAGAAAEIMRRHGVSRRVIDRDELLRLEPALNSFADHIVGGTYTPTDESGDARAFTQALAEKCQARGARFLYNHEVTAITQESNATVSVAFNAVNNGAAGRIYQNEWQTLTADHVVVASGSYSAPLLRSLGVNLPIYPGKGYSATFKVLKPEAAPLVSMIDDEKKVAISRLGDELRVAGTIEVGDYDLTLDSPVARARCRMLSRRIEQVLPGVCDTRTPEDGGHPNYWAGLRPATPTNIPFIGQTPIRGLWVNAGHGTLGWTHGAGSGKALAELIYGETPDMAFNCYGFAPRVV
jgi:D-amino-acid dehydrogenase